MFDIGWQELFVLAVFGDHRDWPEGTSARHAHRHSLDS